MPDDTTTPDWRSLGDLQTLLSPGGIQALLAESGVVAQRVACGYIRLKPGLGALLGIEIELRAADGSAVTVPGYIRTHRRERAEQLARKWHTGRTVPTALGEGVQLLNGGRSVLFVYPNDARLRGLRFVSEPDKLKRTLAELSGLRSGEWRIRARKSTFRTVRYKPERRLILEADLALKNDRTGERSARRVFVRFFHDDRGRRIARLCSALSEVLPPIVPSPLGCSRDGRLFVEHAVDGRGILPVVLEGTADGAGVADMLGRLHACRVGGLARRSVRDILTTAVEDAQNLALVDPDAQDVVSRLEHALYSSAPSTDASATLHGDCHLHQVMIASDTPVLVDFERAVAGHPLYDLGLLVAHLERIARREPDRSDRLAAFGGALVERYSRAHPENVARALPFFVACGLVQQALLPFRRLEADWRDDSRACLERALTTLERPTHRAPRAPPDRVDARFFDTREPSPDGNRPLWDVFYPRPHGAWPGVVRDPDGTRRHGTYDVHTDRFQERRPEADRDLPGLVDWLPLGDLVAYRPGKRATVRIEDRDGVRFCKVVPLAKVGGLVRKYRAVADLVGPSDRTFPRTPSLVYVDEHRGVLVFERLGGVSLHSCLTSGVVDAGFLRNVACAIASWHRICPDARAVPCAKPHVPLAQWIEFVAPHDPGLAARGRDALAIVEELPQGPFGPTDRLVHGDLHDRNVLLKGDHTVLLDLDRCGTGDAVEDVGNLVAHLILRGLQTDRPIQTTRSHARYFVSRYARERSDPMHGVVAVTARTLFRLACLYRFRRRWHALAPRLLEECLSWAHAERSAGGSTVESRDLADEGGS